MQHTSRINCAISEAELDRLASRLPAFGGLYGDNLGNLHVYLVDSMPSNRQDVEFAVHEYLSRSDRSSRPIIVERGDYTLSQLRSWQPLVDGLLGIKGVLSTDLNEAMNRLHVRVINSSVLKEVQGLVSNAGIPAGAVTLEISDPVQPASSLNDSLRPLRGGNRITSFAVQPCTMGFNAFDVYGRRVFYTASHCVGNQGELTGIAIYQPHFPSNNLVGYEVADPPFTSYSSQCPVGRTCRWSEMAVVEFEDPSHFDLGRIHKTEYRDRYNGSTEIDASDPYFTIVEFTYFPTSSDINQLVLNKMGHNTGWTNGRLKATCVNENYYANGVDTGRTLLCQDHVWANAQTGDSGSPVFRKIGDNQADLYGIVWGRFGTSYFIFSSMWNIRGEFWFNSVY